MFFVTQEADLWVWFHYALLGQCFVETGRCWSIKVITFTLIYDAPYVSYDTRWRADPLIAYIMHHTTPTVFFASAWMLLLILSVVAGVAVLLLWRRSVAEVASACELTGSGAYVAASGAGVDCRVKSGCARYFGDFASRYLHLAFTELASVFSVFERQGDEHPHDEGCCRTYRYEQCRPKPHRRADL